MADDLKKMYKTIMDDHFPPQMEISFVDGDNRQTLFYEKVDWVIEGVRKGLRYGENPGQEAALYRLANGNLVLGETRTIAPGQYLASDIELLQSGKHPGKTNLTDADNALNILRYFTDTPCAIIVKHNNPCGAAVSESLADAYAKAYMADRVAAFGGCIAVNRALDKPTAEAVANQYAEVIVAPEYEDGVRDILAKRKNLRVIQIQNIERLQSFVGQRVVEFKNLIDGGLITQWSFVPEARSEADFKLAECEYKGEVYRINRPPTKNELADIRFGWLLESGVTSNSVLYVKDGVSVGIGTGEQDRVGVAEIARDKAYRKLADRYCFEQHNMPYNELADGDKKNEINARVKAEKGGLTGATMVSDAFFPFRDGVDVGLREGVTAVVHPGGSLNDYQSIEACNENNATMVLTGQRSFKH
ncbi:phosphoribosylaminoimidazolecarboxamide formyltransferase/IMP cyclohydrolase [Desulfosalsimonas propionicica]|uniref:Phosphoribosylaminoimidazolecarboxamide formyltransferase/IMP cyclohydrolase n=1 Tax=Desulfosalsimonas propionicica TaxID=332175 RepID=A0A7W0CC42_9BACT|nr:IMP cyclohydrolase [Desulfosalsimonas propionicica]MBA2882942.1 phosphoribosylaminoimidazolecarboxamide formyltransferase/IMP cyclohydrolase [Desulfosalsimonas propionicica]